MEMSLYQRYLSTKRLNPQLPTRDVAENLNVSEAELAYARVGHDMERLNISASVLLAELAHVGLTQSVTANQCARHEITGEYQNLRLHGHLGLILNPRALDLRLFFRQWDAIFSLYETTPQGEQRSIQCFDLQGNLIHQIYCIDETDLNAWQALVAQYRTKDNTPLVLHPRDEELSGTAPINNALIDAEWRKMNDIHQFFMLLKRHKITRKQAFRAVSDDLAFQVDNQSLSQILRAAQARQNEIMLFVGNSGCIQIFTGVIEQLIVERNTHAYGQLSINVLNQRFKLYLNKDAIAEIWVTRKPTKDGYISSLELLDNQGKHILQVFGQRNEGQSEQSQWIEQLAELTVIESTHE
ncbi:hemin transport protein [Yersinia intermedia]|uniref:Hemin-degrading factor n=1 Tax=Yersinia intermedia TaxID=631 RepID=A0A209A4V2_YERIN|nr:hemin-degrading factor [Yersinia intermedia]OVZ87553.1 hemin-degrading factor [Yersinia intermedia]UZM72898.1 hemin-degrading factor [Yersinia intermedia]CNB66442.1 hemin transport protein [Yersinia intermedia]CNG07839.1 hemin transport protein [Yersinia intermedia]